MRVIVIGRLTNDLYASNIFIFLEKKDINSTWIFLYNDFQAASNVSKMSHQKYLKVYYL